MDDQKDSEAGLEVIPAPIPTQLERLDNRVRQIEKIAETIEKVTASAVDVATKYIESKAEKDRKDTEVADAQHQRETETQDKQHKRTMMVLTMVIGMIFCLVVISLLKNQFDLVKVILGSSLAVAGGAGLAGMLRKSSK